MFWGLLCSHVLGFLHFHPTLSWCPCTSTSVANTDHIPERHAGVPIPALNPFLGHRPFFTFQTCLPFKAQLKPHLHDHPVRQRALCLCSPGSTRTAEQAPHTSWSTCDVFLGGSVLSPSLKVCKDDILILTLPCFLLRP